MDLKNLSILVTGGAGFIGSNIVEYLINNEVKFVRILDNLSTGNKNNIEPFLGANNIEFMWGDIRDLETCRRACKNIDIICHQAALGSVPRSIDNPLDSHNVNVNGFVHILCAAKEAGIKRVVYASSSSVYGSNVERVKVEDENKKPLSPYSVTKCVDELYGHIFSHTYDMECIGLRYFNVFGPRQNPNGAYAAVIPKFIKIISCGQNPVIYGTGEFSRDFTYIDNIVYANILALTTNNTECYGQVFNVGTNNSVSINDLFNHIKKILNNEISVPIYTESRKGDVPNSNASIINISRMLGYSPKIYFIEGLEKTVAYYVKK